MQLWRGSPLTLSAGPGHIPGVAGGRTHGFCPAPETAATAQRRPPRLPRACSQLGSAFPGWQNPAPGRRRPGRTGRGEGRRDGRASRAWRPPAHGGQAPLAAAAPRWLLAPPQSRPPPSFELRLRRAQQEEGSLSPSSLPPLRSLPLPLPPRPRPRPPRPRPPLPLASPAPH